MIDILSYLPAKRKQTGSGWISFNCPCCVHKGESPDRRQRGGLKTNEQGWSYHCFNCGFTASFIMGRNLTFKARQLLQWLNVPDEEIDRINLESLKQRSIQSIIDERQKVSNVLQGIDFKEKELPPGVELVTPDLKVMWDYIRSRGVPEDYPIMTVTSNDGVHWTRSMVIVPFTYDNTLVGYSCRMLDGRTPKYIHDIQPGYVFGTDLQHPDWKHVLVTEGVFDALCIGGLAVLHNEISEVQARLIRSLGREVTVIPDQDEAGLKLLDAAEQYGWSVSVPDWHDDVKDVNDAVARYGRAATMLSIFEARCHGKIMIEMMRKKIKKKL